MPSYRGYVLAFMGGVVLATTLCTILASASHDQNGLLWEQWDAQQRTQQYEELRRGQHRLERDQDQLRQYGLSPC